MLLNVILLSVLMLPRMFNCGKRYFLYLRWQRVELSHLGVIKTIILSYQKIIERSTFCHDDRENTVYQLINIIGNRNFFPFQPTPQKGKKSNQTIKSDIISFFYALFLSGNKGYSNATKLSKRWCVALCGVQYLFSVFSIFPLSICIPFLLSLDFTGG